MKSLSLLILTLFCTIGAKAQPWIVPGTGNIYYNGSNVGIGTSAPQANADIATAGAMYLPNTSGSTNTAILRIGYGDHSWAGGQLDMGIYNGGSYPAWIQARNPANYSINRNLLLNPNGGNIGIGTTSLLAKLDINAINYDSNQDGGISIKANGGNANGIWQTRFILKSNSGGTPRAAIDFVTRDYNTGNVVTNIEALSISANGKVGIGTTTPDATLDLKSSNGSYALKVVTSASANTALSIGGSSDINGVTAGYEAFTILNVGEDSGSQRSIFAAGNIKTGRNLTAGGILTLRGTDNSSIAGNVCIGTTTPDSEAKLTVKGKIVASEIQVKDIGVIADYVFKPDYQLMSLEKVEDFVKQNQHLPEVPSEKEFKKDGMNVAEMNVLLLKKVEELTLYAIKQNKKAEEQNKKVKELTLYSIDQDKSLKEQAKKIEALEKTVNNLISK